MSAFLGLIGSGLSAVSNWINNQNNILNQQQANAFNERMMQTQMGWSSQEAQNAYNRQRQLYTEFQSPSAMVRQLQEAGLSQGLMYGMNGAGGSMTSAPQANSTAMAEATAPQQQTLLDAQIMALMANARKTAAEAEEHEAGAEEKRGNLTVQEQVKLTMQKQREEINQNIVNQKKQFDVMCADIERINSERDENNANKELMEAKKAYEEAMTNIQTMLANQQVENLKEEVKKMKAEEAKLYAEAKKANVEATTLQKQQDDLVKLIHLQYLDAAMKYKYITPNEAKRIQAIADQEEQRAAIRKTLTEAAYKMHDKNTSFYEGLEEVSKLLTGRFLLK